MNYVALDFETANHSWSSICAVGIAVVQDGNVVERGSWLIRPPGLYFHPMFTRIHGIRAEDVKDKPDFSELWYSVLKDYLVGKTVIAHNASFDLGVLRHTLSEYLIPHPRFSYQCSVVIARRTWPGLGSYKLDNLARRFGIKFRHHDASEDAFACAKIVLEAGAALGANSFNELVNKLYIKVKSFLPGER
ncbi:MAG TPA: 3'-5' exonuclease [Bacillota bacterium]|nr:3'-5' exonuclease [Peptococcaceae bacterium MAG4]HPZ43295.1 3'-5' exonuclease [Bacillota bacterium]HQD75166.1 3'-5' exonuclease [Bacillota bacterium]